MKTRAQITNILMLPMLLLPLLSCKAQSNTIEEMSDMVLIPPFFRDSTASYIPYMYGMNDTFSRDDDIDPSFFPEISDLHFKSCLETCPKDSCEAKRAVLAVSCPKKETLLRWVSEQAADFTNKCIEENSCHIATNYSLQSVDAICNYYIGKTDAYFKRLMKKCNNDDNAPCEQRGRMIADIWQKGELHTFVISDWYDWLSCCDTTQQSYITVDAITGKELSLSDFIDDESLYPLSRLVQWHLVNQGEVGGEDEYNQSIEADSMMLLAERDGCALLAEGLIVYYYPYTIGLGYQGEFFTIIPYEELKAKGIKLKL